VRMVAGSASGIKSCCCRWWPGRP